MIQLPRLILASGSPRRSEILQSVGWHFEKRVADIDESERPGESPEDYVVRLAREKAESVRLGGNELVLGADTTVVVEGGIVGKPTDTDDAARMLRSLSGRWHDVLTGIAIADEVGTVSAMQRTSVKFAVLDEPEIAFLVEKGDPLDKAGAYAVQAQAALFIEEIKGDYWNVVGLPVNLVYELITKKARSA